MDNKLIYSPTVKKIVACKMETLLYSLVSNNQNSVNEANEDDNVVIKHTHMHYSQTTDPMDNYKVDVLK